jgi:tetratricopeptide (TPR) repeat protein
VESPEGVKLNVRLAESLADTFRYDEAERHLVYAIKISQQINGDANEDTVKAIHQLALLRMAQGHFVEAEKQARRAIAAYQQVPGASTTRAMIYHAALANAFIGQGRYKDAARSVSAWGCPLKQGKRTPCSRMRNTH